ncbi:MAG: HAD hydrolase-like protein [Clostridiales bacterium]|nr:HAD hydrolase-like protein [Clostridiales bacterium]
MFRGELTLTGLEYKDWQIEVLKDDIELGKFKAAVFDFDGTISLIREGWQQVMIPYFIEELQKTPKAEDEESISRCVRDFVDFHTGKQTIYQCIRLAEEIETRDGKPEDPLKYKKEYHRRLMDRIEHRIAGLREGLVKPEDAVVPGSMELLNMLRERGLVLYLASGTDENYVLEEAKLLKVTKYFNGGIYGARDEYKLFSKAMVIRNIIKSHELSGKELIGFGDGYVEIENIKSFGGFAVGVASDEVNKCGIDEWKRKRLTRAGADIILPDYRQLNKIEGYIFPRR